MPQGTSCTDNVRFVYCDSSFRHQVLKIIFLHMSSEMLTFEVHLTVKRGNSSTSSKSYLSHPYLPSLCLLKPQSAQQRQDFKPKEMALNVCRSNDAPKSWTLSPATVQVKCDGTRRRTGGEVKGKLANGVGSQYSHTTSEHGVSSITTADAHTSAASSRLN